MTTRADLATMTSEQIVDAFDENRFDGILSGITAGSDGADQGARGPGMRGSFSERQRAELRTLSGGEISARLDRGDYGDLLGGAR